MVVAYVFGLFVNDVIEYERYGIIYNYPLFYYTRLFLPLGLRHSYPSLRMTGISTYLLLVLAGNLGSMYDNIYETSNTVFF